METWQRPIGMTTPLVMTVMNCALVIWQLSNYQSHHITLHAVLIMQQLRLYHSDPSSLFGQTDWPHPNSFLCLLSYTPLLGGMLVQHSWLRSLLDGAIMGYPWVQYHSHLQKLMHFPTAKKPHSFACSERYGNGQVFDQTHVTFHWSNVKFLSVSSFLWLHMEFISLIAQCWDSPDHPL